MVCNNAPAYISEHGMDVPYHGDILYSSMRTFTCTISSITLLYNFTGNHDEMAISACAPLRCSNPSKTFPLSTVSHQTTVPSS